MGDDDVTDIGPIRATWASIEPSVDTVGDLARFAVGHQLRDVFLVVPWRQQGAAVRHAAEELGAEGVAVSAVATDPRWATDPRPFMQWIRRVRTAGGDSPGAAHGDGLPADEGGEGPADGTVFSGVHLDVEPWRLPVWDRDRARATRGLVELVRRARALAPGLPLSADLPHWLAAEPYWPPPEEEDDKGPAGATAPVVATATGRTAEPPSSAGGGLPGTDPRHGDLPSGQASGRPRIRPTDQRTERREPAASGSADQRVGGATVHRADGAAGPMSGQGEAAAGPVSQRGDAAVGATGWSALSREPGMPRMRIREPARVAASGRSRTSVFEAVLAQLDSVTILVPRTRAHGQGGILDVSAKARAACIQRGVPYMIGLETRPTTDPRRPRATFHDHGALALARESGRLREALGTDPLFLGVAVHDWAAWNALA